MLKKSLIVSAIAALILTGCSPMRTQGTATESAICRALGEGLPTRSRSDTQQTQDEIGALYADFVAACPRFKNLVPGKPA